MRTVRLLTASAISFLLAGICLWILLSVNGCSFNKLDWETSDIFYHSPPFWKCLERTRELSRRLVEHKVAHSIVYGYYRRKPHAWVEISGKIYDPSVLNTSSYLYKNRYYVEDYPGV